MYKLNMYMLGEVSNLLQKESVNQEMIQEWCNIWVLDEGIDGNYGLDIVHEEVQSLLDVEIGF